MPAIAKLAAENKELTVIGVNDDDDPAKAAKYLAEKGYQWLNVFDGKDKRARADFKILGIPTLILIDREGVVAQLELGSGATAEESIREALAKLAGRPSKQ